MPIVNRVADMHEEITAWRRDIHEHPEIGFDVHRTAGIVADKLRAFGCDEVVPGIGKTGVVGVIKGRKAASGKVVGLRADMDALPIQEMTGVPYASKTPGKMHACGHDGHTAMLLGAAKYLCETRNFDGTVVVVFQPNEEGLTGSLAMVEDGLIERFGIQQVFGMHTSPNHELGKFAHLRRAHAGGVRQVHDRDHRQGLACGAPARGHRSRGGGGADHHGAADHRLAHHRSARRGRGLDLHGARRRSLQHHPAERGA